uniref:Uncharacterized protein n=1 Tax=Cacopsylla melanoneura TaxID=428564 RepID=A0A8D8PPM2_9HEMI
MLRVKMPTPSGRKIRNVCGESNTSSIMVMFCDWYWISKPIPESHNVNILNMMSSFNLVILGRKNIDDDQRSLLFTIFVYKFDQLCLSPLHDFCSCGVKVDPS